MRSRSWGSANLRFTPRSGSHQQSCCFKGDLREPTPVQAVTQQMNLHAGINLNKIRRYVLDLVASPTEAQGLYLDRGALVAMMGG